MKVSASLIKSFMKCGLQGRFAYIDKIEQQTNAAASFGSAVHLALELYNNTQDVEKAVSTFKYVWDNPDEFDLKPDIWPPRTSFSQYRERGEKFIRDYHEKNKWVKKNIIATEHKFCVDIGNHQLSGIVDILEVPDGLDVLKVVDLKTGYRPNANNLEFDIQFSSYLYAVKQPEFWLGYGDKSVYPGFKNGKKLWEKFKDYRAEGIWYDLRNNKEYAVGQRESRDYWRLYYCIDAIAKAVEEDVFVPSISGDACGVCSYFDLCPVYSLPNQTSSEESE